MPGPSGPNLLRVAGLVSLLVLLLGVIGLFALFQAYTKSDAALGRLEALHSAQVAAVTAQVGFKTQVQEWKNILLRGGNAQEDSLDETIFNFVTTFTGLRAGSPAVGPFLDNLVESLNTLVLTAVDAVQSGDPGDRDMLLAMTTDRGDLMERLRRSLLERAPLLEHQHKAHLFYLTALFERAVWLLRQVTWGAPGAPQAPHAPGPE